MYCRCTSIPPWTSKSSCRPRLFLMSAYSESVTHQIYYGIDLFVALFLLIRFYIGCDECQDWFHGRCVGVSKTEADDIQTYICPRCQNSSTKNMLAFNSKALNSRVIESLKRLIRSMMVSQNLMMVIFWLSLRTL